MRSLRIILLATFLPGATAWAQSPVAPPGRFAVSVSAGGGLFSGDTESVTGAGFAAEGEATLAPTWFLRAQYGNGPVDRFTVGIARSFAHLRPRAFLSAEAGVGSFTYPTRRSGVYAGAGLQAPLNDSGLVFAAEGKLFVLSEQRGVSFLAGLKMHF